MSEDRPAREQRLTPAREQYIRSRLGGYITTDEANEVFAELDAVRQERDLLVNAIEALIARVSKAPQ